MTIKRGDFVLVCNSCGQTVDLETDDFDEAKELANDHKEQNGWMTVMKRGKYVDICGGPRCGGT